MLAKNSQATRSSRMHALSFRFFASKLVYTTGEGDRARPYLHKKPLRLYFLTTDGTGLFAPNITQYKNPATLIATRNQLIKNHKK